MGVLRYPTRATRGQERFGAMLTRGTRIDRLHPFHQADPAPTGAAIVSPVPDPPPLSDSVLGEAGERALRAEREARREADRRWKAAEDRLAALAVEAKERADAEAAEQGKWRELAEGREADLATTVVERDALRLRAETLERLAAERLSALIGALPAEIAALAPDESTPIEKRLAWAEKAAKAAERVTTPGNGPNPKPAGNEKPAIPRVVPPERMW